MIALLVIAGLLGSISILAMAWAWVSVLAGWREASPGRAFAMLWFLLLLIGILGFGIDSDYSMARLSVLALWPVSIIFLLKAAVAAKLFIFICAALILVALIGVVTAIIPGKAKVPTVIVGAMLAVISPVMLQNVQVQWQMTKSAEASELRIIERSTLFESIRDRSDGYQDPHGVACDTENWPYLWSYRYRDWIALPTNTRYGGDSKERVMSVCLQR